MTIREFVKWDLAICDLVIGEGAFDDPELTKSRVRQISNFEKYRRFEVAAAGRAG